MLLTLNFFSINHRSQFIQNFCFSNFHCFTVKCIESATFSIKYIMCSNDITIYKWKRTHKQRTNDKILKFMFITMFVHIHRESVVIFIHRNIPFFDDATSRIKKQKNVLHRILCFSNCTQY